jgi:hypothetical protein
MAKQLFLNSWQKGSAENANLGNGVFVGCETYSKKGIAQLTKDAINSDGGVITDLPLYVTQNASFIYIQGDTGKVYQTDTSGSTWTDISNGSSSGTGQGLVIYQGYLFAFRGGRIDYYKIATASWTTNWQPNGAAPGLTSNTDPMPVFIYPGDNKIYFGNGKYVGKLGQVGTTTFDPGGSGGVDYEYSYGPSNTTGGTVTFGLTLPSFYKVSAISFLGNAIALGLSSDYQSNVSDIIMWTPTLSTYETPLRLYSQAENGENGVKQLLNRNNVLYAVVGGSHAIFRTNGQSFSLVADLSLLSNIRKVTGAQAQVPVFMDPRVGAIDMFGNKLLTGVSTPHTISNYPSGYGLFPCGVWSVAFEGASNALNYTSDSVQCEYTISTGTVVAVNKTFTIGMVKCLDSNRTFIGWQDGTAYGVDLVDTNAYQNDIGSVFIESEMMEIGTPFNPETIQTIQFNTPRQLMDGQTVRFNWRTGFDQDFTFLQDFTSANNNDNGYKIALNSIGATRFLQLQVQMASTISTNYSPELRDIIIAP